MLQVSRDEMIGSELKMEVEDVTLFKVRAPCTRNGPLKVINYLIHYPFLGWG